MKIFAKTLVGLMFTGLISCTSARYAGNQHDDDVYYTPSDDIYTQTSSGTQTNSNSSSPASPEDYTQSDENSYTQQDTEIKPAGNVTNNYYGDYYDYDYDDYYDYAYASRIRRFYSPIYSFGYYDPWYTNAYWYSYNPVYYGTSIYLGYSWWYPSPWSWNIGWNSYYGWNVGWNWGWGYPYGGCGYYGMSYYNPYWYGNSYWHGYNNGYWNGYNNGYNDGLYANNNYYYNSYDANSYYYGPRSSTSSNGSRDHRSLGENYQNSVGSEKAFNSRFSDVPKITGSRGEPTGVSNVSSGSGAGTKVQPVKENPAVSPDRDKINEINSYSTPKGLNQKGGNIQSSPKGNTMHENNKPVVKEVVPDKNSDFGTIKENSSGSKAGNEYVQPERNRPGFENVKKNNDYSAPEKYSQPKENNKDGFYEPGKNPERNHGTEPKGNKSYDSPKKHNTPRENSWNSSPKSNGSPSFGKENSGRMSIPHSGGNSSGGGSIGSGGGGSRGNFSPAPSGSGNSRRGK